MKLRALCVVLLVFSSARADPDYYKLEDTQGRVVEARILEFDPVENIVKLKLHNKQVRSAPLAVFSEKSQLCIRDWHQREILLSDKNLVVSINKKSLLSDRYHEVRNGWQSHYPGMDYEDVAFEMEILNKNSDALTNIRVEYCTYCERTIDETTCKLEVVPDWGYRGTDHEELPQQKTIETSVGTISIPALKKNVKLTEITKEVRLYDGTEGKNDIPALKGRYRTVKDKVLGIRVRASIPLPSGSFATKEFSYPTDLIDKTEWKSSDSGISSEPGTGTLQKSLSDEETLQLIHTFINEGKFTEAISLCRHLYSNSDRLKYHGAWRLGNIYLSHENPDRNIDLGEEWMLKASEGGFAGPYSDLAEFYACDPDPSMRDGKKAVKYADMMMAIRRKTDAPGPYRTMACALARDGQYSKAADMMHKAVANMEKRLGKELQPGHEYLSMLDQFSNNQAWPN